MTDKKIEELRIKLNSLVEQGADFEEIQKVSLLLDKCLVDYYSKEENSTQK